MANSKYQQTILVIEDDHAHDGMLSLTLATRGYKILTAASGQEAIVKSSLPVDLIIIDWLLPDMNGMEVCHYLKQIDSTRNIPVILISDRLCPISEKVECFQLGADDLLCKPFDHEELFARIFALLRRNYSSSTEPDSQRAQHVRQLREIINQGLVEPNFQPVYMVDSTCEFFGVEILSRPLINGVLKNPELLFQVAFDLGLYYELEIMVWRKALELIKTQVPCPNIFLNCNPCMIENDNFSEVLSLFQEVSILPENVFFELTERSAISQYAIFCERLQKFRDSGFRMAVDDVGCGYASLESIIETRPEVIKIDRHIVHGITNNEYKRSMVKFIVSFCSEHDIICVAEGVETSSEYVLLKSLGVKAFQGYYFYKPSRQMNIAAFKNMLT